MEGERQFHLYILYLSTILCLLSFILELCWNENPWENPLDGPKIKYTRAHLLNLRSKAHSTRIDMDTCKHIKRLSIKRNFRRKRGGKRICQRKLDYNIGIPHNLLRPLERSDKTFRNLIKLNMVLVNIQSLKPKLDVLIHHMQINNKDIGFVTETWIQYGNEPEYQYIKANLDTAGYNILIQSWENQRGRGIAVIYKTRLQVKKLTFNQYTSFKSLTINLNISTKSYLLLQPSIDTPYSTDQPITMLTFLDEFPDHISNLLRSSRNISILGDFNIPWNISEHPNITSMQEIMDMHDLKQHIHIQMYKLGNTLDWLISNSPNNILDITNKDFPLDHCIIEWKFQVSLKVREKMQTSRRDLSKIEKKIQSWPEYESRNRDRKDTSTELQQLYGCHKNTMDKHAPLITKTKTKKTIIPGSTKIHKGSKPNEEWLRKGGSNQKNMKTSWNTSTSTQYIRSTYIMPRKHLYCTN